MDYDGSITATVLVMAKNSECPEYSMDSIQRDVGLEEFTEVYNALSEQFGTEKLTVEETSELLNI